MKKIGLAFFFVIGLKSVLIAQTASSFYVSGDSDKYYPVTFDDPGVYLNRTTIIEIGRSNVHEDALWRGSLISKFSYHTTNYGHGSQFIDADIRGNTYFIAGWADATNNNAKRQIIIWLKGGGNTYYLNSEFNLTAVVYDGVQNALPFQEQGGPAHNYKTQLDDYVSNYVSVKNANAYFTAGGNNYFNGKVGIGIFNPSEKLAVNGNIRAKEVKVETANWPDYVFTKDYQLPSLQQTENHIKEKGHLPGIPSAAEVKANGIDLGEMNAKLLQKIEELTLHLIEKDKETKVLKNENIVIKSKLDEIILLLNKKNIN